MTVEHAHASRPPSLPLREAPEPRGKSRWWIWLIVVLVVGAAAYFILPRFLHAQTKTGPPAQGQRAIPVVTAVVRQGDVNLYLNGLGTVTALNTVTVRSRVDGELVNVAYTEGQMVKKDDLLAEIDPRPYQVQLAGAEGQLAKDEATLKNAQLDLTRYQQLITTKTITQQQLDAQVSLVKQFEGAAKSDQSQVDNVKLNLTYCRIIAPLSGRIGLRPIDQGNMVHANDPNPLAVITQLQPISVVFTIPQDDIARVIHRMSPGQPLVVEAYDRDLKNRLATGKLAATDNQVDPTTGTVRLKAEFQNEDGVLFPNEFVNARLLVDTLKGVTIVPSAAVQRGPDSTFVYVVKPDETVELRNVTIGASEADQTVIESGLNPAEVVVTDGVDKLQPGTKVSARQQAPRSAGTSRPTTGSSTQPATGPAAGLGDMRRGTGGRRAPKDGAR